MTSEEVESGPRDTPTTGESGDDASAERQLFGEQVPTEVGFVACNLGVARVSLAGGRVGHAGLVERCTATSVAADADRIVAGTVRGVLADEGESFERLGEAFEVAAVGLDDGVALAGGDDGRVVRFDRGRGWETVGTVTDPQRFDGNVLAAGDGIYRVTDTLDALGLFAAHDVAAGESLFAATEDGLYRRDGDDWLREHDRPTATVVAAGGRAHAIDDRGVLARDGGEWVETDAPALPVDLAYAGTLWGITGDGTVLVREVDGADGWRTHPLGLRGVVEFVVR